MIVFEYKPHNKYKPRIDKTKCRASVSEGGRGVGHNQCQKKPQKESKWCWMHNPEAVAKRQAANARRSEAKWQNSPHMRLTREIKRLEEENKKLKRKVKELENQLK